MGVGVLLFGNMSISGNPVFANILFVIAPLAMIIGSIRLAATPGITKALEQEYLREAENYKNKKVCTRCAALYY